MVRNASFILLIYQVLVLLTLVLPHVDIMSILILNIWHTFAEFQFLSAI